MPKTSRRKLTAAEQQVAARTKSRWLEKKQAEKLTIESAAHTMGFSGSAFSQYINGQIPMSTDAVKRFADYLGVRPTQLDPNWLGGLQVSTAPELREPQAPYNYAAETPRDVFCEALNRLSEAEIIQVLQGVALSREGSALLAKILVDRLAREPDA